MEEDHPSKNSNNKMPILDMEVWADEEGYIKYTHYQKPVSSTKVMDADSAQSSACKRSVHVQELLRRILNTSARLEWQREVAPVLTEYMKRMYKAGYSEGYRKNILTHTLRIYDRMKNEECEGVRPLYRPKDWEMEKRIIDKKRKKNNWATKGGYTAPIMVPSTPGGELARMLREVAETESTEDVRFKIIETGGRRIKHQLQSSNPTATQGCTDSSCIACQHGKGEGGNCRINNITYEVECLLCKGQEGGERSTYVGESSRNLFTRGGEHKSKYENHKDDSFLVKHQLEEHQGAAAEVTAKVTGVYPDCLTRQIAEGVLISKSNTVLMNTKSEWHQPPIWRVQSEIVRI